MQKVLISMDDMPFLMTVIVGVKHISLTGLHHAVELVIIPHSTITSKKTEIES